jgi:LuxR family transcriptional regulator, maltose regulon positive regulatory protein
VYLSQAASTVLECDEPTLPRFVAEHFSDLTGFARLFFRAFFAQLPAELILVFDNYQDVAESAPLHDIVSQAVAEVPPGSSIVAVSRMEVPRQFVKRIADNAVAHIGADSLQLNLDEVRAVCRERQVTDEWLLKALHQQSAGWAAGITLMLERLGHADGASHELPTDTREAVFDYFASLIFDREPEATRHILLSIALLPRVTIAGPGRRRSISFTHCFSASSGKDAKRRLRHPNSPRSWRAAPLSWKRPETLTGQ